MTLPLALLTLSIVGSLFLGRFCALSNEPDELVDEEGA